MQMKIPTLQPVCPLGYYSSECLVNNPYFLDAIENCFPCEKRTAFVEIPADKIERQMRHVDELVPFVIKVC